MTLLLLIVLVLLLVGGPYYGYRNYGPTGGTGHFCGRAARDRVACSNRTLAFALRKSRRQ